MKYMLPVIKTVSPQTSDVYKLLNGGEGLSAQDIADRLGILPNAVYRVVKKLVAMGLIEQLDGYPARFQAVSAQTAMNMYLVAAGQSFRREFGMLGSVAAPASDAPTISFIKDRPSMLHRQISDTRAARQSIDLIVSGHPIAEENVLAYRKAITTGVKIRKIVHQSEQAKSQWSLMEKEIGVNIRYLPNLDIRLIIFDKRVVYMTSYDAKRPSSAFGIRFEYVPLALQMSELFEQNWQKAKPQ